MPLYVEERKEKVCASTLGSCVVVNQIYLRRVTKQKFHLDDTEAEMRLTVGRV